MNKGLLRKIGANIILPLAFLGVIGCEQYDEKLNIDGNKVFYNSSNPIFVPGFGWKDVKEKKKDGTIIKYDICPSLFNKPDSFKLYSLKIDGEVYNSWDSLDAPVFDSANVRVHKLVNRYYFLRDSTKQADGFKALK